MYSLVLLFIKSCILLGPQCGVRQVSFLFSHSWISTRDTNTEKIRISPFQTKGIHHFSLDCFDHKVHRKPRAHVVDVSPLPLRLFSFYGPQDSFQSLRRHRHFWSPQWVSDRVRAKCLWYPVLQRSGGGLCSHFRECLCRTKVHSLPCGGWFASTSVLASSTPHHTSLISTMVPVLQGCYVYFTPSLRV